MELLDGAGGVGGGTVGDVPAGAGDVDEPPLLAPGPDWACAAPAIATLAARAIIVLLTMGSSKLCLQDNPWTVPALHGRQRVAASAASWSVQMPQPTWKPIFSWAS